MRGDRHTRTSWWASKLGVKTYQHNQLEGILVHPNGRLIFLHHGDGWVGFLLQLGDWFVNVSKIAVADLQQYNTRGLANNICMCSISPLLSDYVLHFLWLHTINSSARTTFENVCVWVEGGEMCINPCNTARGLDMIIYGLLLFGTHTAVSFTRWIKNICTHSMRHYSNYIYIQYIFTL